LQAAGAVSLAAQDLEPVDVQVTLDSALRLAQTAATGTFRDLPDYLLYSVTPRALKGDPGGLHWQVQWQERAFPHHRRLIVRVYMKDGHTTTERLSEARAAESQRPLESQQTDDSSTAVRAIRVALAAWMAAANRQDWRAAAEIWAPDLIGWYPGQPDDTYAKEMALAIHPRPGRKPTRYEVTVNEVIVSGSWAVVRDTWRFTTGSGSADSSVAVVRSFEVWRRQPDRAWKIARWISAPEPAPRP
jgi:ketosteroid isomerase-like protein